MGQTDKYSSWKVAHCLLDIDSMLVTFMDMFFRLVKRSYKSVTLPIHMQVLEGVMEKIYVVEE